MNEKFNENLRKARTDLWDLYGTFTNVEKRMFWRGIIERIEYGNDKRFTVRFVR